MLDTINKFRVKNGRQLIAHLDKLVSNYCKLHCLAMSKERDIRHAPDCYLDDWQEAVAMVPYNEHWKDQVIFGGLGMSKDHADMLLNCDTIACDYHIENWMVYVCVRGRITGG